MVHENRRASANDTVQAVSRVGLVLGTLALLAEVVTACGHPEWTEHANG